MRKNEYVLFLFCKKIKSWHGVCFINKCKMQKANKLKCVEIEIWMTKRGGAMIGLIIATHGNSSVELIESCIEAAQDGIKSPTKIMKERR